MLSTISSTDCPLLLAAAGVCVRSTTGMDDDRITDEEAFEVEDGDEESLTVVVAETNEVWVFGNELLGMLEELMDCWTIGWVTDGPAVDTVVVVTVVVLVAEVSAGGNVSTVPVLVFWPSSSSLVSNPWVQDHK